MTTAPHLPPCPCDDDRGFHAPSCPWFDPALDPPALADIPPVLDPITAIRMKYADRDAEDL